MIKIKFMLSIMFFMVTAIGCGNAADEGSSLSSLTGKDYKGKKYYMGFGDLLDGEMGNEVKYDITHTNDIFTKKWGGDYLGETVIQDQGADGVRAYWEKIKPALSKDDMYVQYSSGHGYNGGLAFGFGFDEIRDHALSLPVKEVIIFTMSCYSGSILDSFNQKKDVWKEWKKEGRTLFIMASSQASQESQTGPGTDVDEPNGPDGSAGSAFGHALWKALIGYADGYVDGVKDGFISLGEIINYTTWKTTQIASHTPVVGGSYNPNLIMNRVPSKAFLQKLENGTEGMSDEEISQLVKELDEELRL